jgi:hypothetical protein
MNIKFNLKSNNYYNVCRHMLIMTKHHFAYNLWDFKWLLLDDKSNTYIDVNQLSRKLVVS